MSLWLARGSWQLARRHPLILITILLIGAGWYALETQIARPAMVYMGVPVLEAEGIYLKRILRNDAFMVGYSEWLGNPLWVSYQVLPKPKEQPYLPRPERFREDWRTVRCLTVLACVDHDSYTGSGYDRGHLAPNHVIATRYGARAQEQTFLMTNISPQTPELNRRAWQRLETISANDFAERYAPFWVITGPIFDGPPRHLPGMKRIAIPDAFYKIFVREEEDGPVALAFIMPQNIDGNADLRDYLVSIREIEQRTGLNFFHQLDPEVEERLETTITPEAWGFNKALATRPSRF